MRKLRLKKQMFKVMEMAEASYFHGCRTMRLMVQCVVTANTKYGVSVEI